MMIGITALTPGKADAGIVYENNFDIDASGFSNFTTIQTMANGERFIGLLAKGATSTLTLAGLPTHGRLRISFNLYAYGSLDGDSEVFGNGKDHFSASWDGINLLMQNTFVNINIEPVYPDATQNFPVPGSIKGTGSIAYDPTAFGYIPPNPPDPNQTPGIYTYEISFEFPHTAPSIFFDFWATTNGPIVANQFNDEGFGIDNVVVSVLPEVNTAHIMSTSIVMLIAGSWLWGLGRSRDRYAGVF